MQITSQKPCTGDSNPLHGASGRIGSASPILRKVSTTGCRPARLFYGLVTKTPLYRHQLTGVLTLETHPYFGLFDEPGTGKTAMALYAAADLILGGKLDAAVIVARAEHIRTWRKEIEKHLGKTWLKVTHTLTGRGPDDRSWNPKVKIHLINYELLSARKKVAGTLPIPWGRQSMRVGADAIRFANYLRQKRCVLILDESQAIKSPSAQMTRVLCALGKLAMMRWCLTGTPVSERPTDVWSQLFFLDHGATLGKSYYGFLHHFAVMHPRWKRPIRFKNLDELASKMAIISLRRRLDDCVDLPPEVEQDRFFEPSPGQVRILTQLRARVLSALKDTDGSLHSLGKVSGPLHALQRAGAMPSLIDPIKGVQNPKLSSLKEFLADYTDPVLVWCYHRDVAEAVYDALQRVGEAAGLYHGGTKNHEEILNAFESGKVRILAATMNSLRENVTLTWCRHAIYFEPDWSLANWRQSRRRIRRIGQTGTVVLERYNVLGGLDLFINDLLRRKASEADEVQEGSTLGDPKERTRLIAYLEAGGRDI